MKSKFSIIVPVYKAEKYIRRCVDSILNQTFGEFELILVDDGSPDNCGRICDEFAASDSRILVIHQENRGVAIARNNAIDLAQGEYLLFVDSDDFLQDKLLHELNECISVHNSDVIIFGYNVHDENGMREVVHEQCSLPEIKEKLVAHIWAGMPWNKCFNREFFGDSRFPEKMLYEDYYLMPSVIYQAKTINVIGKSLYNYNCCNENSITKKEDSYHRYCKFKAKYRNELLAREKGLSCEKICEINAIGEARRCMFQHYYDSLLTDEQIKDIKEYLSGKDIKNIKLRFWVNRVLKNDVLFCKLYAKWKGYYK